MAAVCVLRHLMSTDGMVYIVLAAGRVCGLPAVAPRRACLVAPEAGRIYSLAESGTEVSTHIPRCIHPFLTLCWAYQPPVPPTASQIVAPAPQNHLIPLSIATTAMDPQLNRAHTAPLQLLCLPDPCIRNICRKHW